MSIAVSCVKKLLRNLTAFFFAFGLCGDFKSVVVSEIEWIQDVSD